MATHVMPMSTYPGYSYDLISNCEVAQIVREVAPGTERYPYRKYGNIQDENISLVPQKERKKERNAQVTRVLTRPHTAKWDHER